MKKIELNIVALANSVAQPGNYALILEEVNGLRRLAIIIGGFEAQAIAVALEGMKTNRPMTHDLFKNALDMTGCSLTEVVISDLVNGAYHATLMMTGDKGDIVGLDARSSDAIALATRYGCKLYATEAVMDEAGFIPDESEKAVTSKPKELSGYSVRELEQLLEQMLAKEDYESAAKIRDEIEKKK